MLEHYRKKNSTAEDKVLNELNKDSETANTSDIPSGTISMENTLKATQEIMSDQPLFYVREALIIIASSNSRDSFDIFESINRINQSYIVINMISLMSTPYIFQ